MDYNMHKSNSTYFADMDMSRTHLFSAIVRRAIRKTAQHMPRSSNNTGGAHMIALGGLACNFKREIKPYRKYEMWSRILCWDRKWFYIVTWCVKPGVGKPKSFTLQPWRKGSVKAVQADAEKLKGAIYSTAIAKYVVKKGRITIPAEQVLLDAEMVPQKPENWVYEDDEGRADGGDDEDAVMPRKHDGQEWNWNVIERERRRGLRFAEAFVELDGLHDVFDGGKDGALGEYPDLLWR
jgi:hypothetical protein